MRLVTGCASRFKRRLVQVRLLHLFRLIAMAGQASGHRIRLHETRRFAGMRIVAVGAIALRSRMLHFRVLDLLGLVGVAGDAERLGVRLASVRLCRLSPAAWQVSHSCSRRAVRERLHQLRLSPTGAGRGTAGSWRCRRAGSGAPSAGPRPSRRGSRCTAPDVALVR